MCAGRVTWVSKGFVCVYVCLKIGRCKFPNGHIFLLTEVKHTWTLSTTATCVQSDDNEKRIPNGAHNPNLPEQGH